MGNETFVKEFAACVQKQARAFGYPICSVVIAQGILESGYGTSASAKKYHNYLGLKWRARRCPIAIGKFSSASLEQDKQGNETSKVSDFFIFGSMKDCVIGYYQFISIPNYNSLRKAETVNQYLDGLIVSGYATDIRYKEKLLKLIQQWSLTQYDREVKQVPSVFLSAGHGGKDPGAVYQGMKEKDATLNIAIACEEVLALHGIKVTCSRTQDENDPVSEEVREANASGADLAVSFHANAGLGDGYEAYCMLNNPDAVRLCNLAEQEMKKLGQNSHGNPLKNGSKLYFVRKTKATAVLFESFFVDNLEDRKIGNTLPKQRAIGVAYAKAILSYFGIAYGGHVMEPELNEEPNKPIAELFRFRIYVDELNIRTGPGVEYTQCGKITDKKVYTIVETRKAKDGGTWGRLKSGAGWVNVSGKYINRI